MRPIVGHGAVGYGVSGIIVAVPDWQPLERDGIWRVALRGEIVVRLVRYAEQQGSVLRWQLLQMDDMTDAQFDAYEAALCMFDADAHNAEHIPRQP